MFGLSTRVITNLTNVFAAHPEVQQAVIFGSRAKGNYRTGSDIDIALKGTITFHIILKMLDEMDDQIFPYSIDLVDYNGISNPAVIEHIDRVGKEIYSKS